MEGAERVREAMERNVKAVKLRPSVARGTAVTKARLGPGLACEAVEGPWRLIVGMTEKYGGSKAGPNPGVYGRTALGAAFAGGPVALADARFDEPTRADAHAEYLASIAPHRRGEGYLVPGEFVIGLAHR